MSFHIGIDIGGTKIAAAVFDNSGKELAQGMMPTPKDYSALVMTCKDIVGQFDQKYIERASVGVGIPGSMNKATGVVTAAANTPCLVQKPLQKDLEKIFGLRIIIDNDADCAALSEARDGAGAGHHTVFGLIMGTGVAGGFVVDGKIVKGANGLIGEFGHLPLPFREPSDGPLVSCACRQKGCIEKSISGSGLARLFERTTGKSVPAARIAEMAQKGSAEARRTLDQFYTTVAKSMIAVIHTFDPDVIVVSGGLSGLPGMYDEVPKRWGQYAISETLKTKFIPAKFGTMTGVRGAAWVGMGQ